MRSELGIAWCASLARQRVAPQPASAPPPQCNAFGAAATSRTHTSTRCSPTRTVRAIHAVYHVQRTANRHDPCKPCGRCTVTSSCCRLGMSPSACAMVAPWTQCHSPLVLAHTRGGCRPKRGQLVQPLAARLLLRTRCKVWNRQRRPPCETFGDHCLTFGYIMALATHARPSFVA